MGSKSWLCLSVLSLGLIALVGCNNAEKEKRVIAGPGYKSNGMPIASSGQQPLPGFSQNATPPAAFPSANQPGMGTVNPVSGTRTPPANSTGFPTPPAFNGGPSMPVGNPAFPPPPSGPNLGPGAPLPAPQPLNHSFSTSNPSTPLPAPAPNPFGRP